MADDLNFDGIDLSGGSAGNFDLSNFDGIDLGGGSAGNFDLSSLLADLSGGNADLGNVLQGQDLSSFLDSLNADLGAKSDLSSNMGMDKELLKDLGLDKSVYSLEPNRETNDKSNLIKTGPGGEVGLKTGAGTSLNLPGYENSKYGVPDLNSLGVTPGTEVGKGSESLKLNTPPNITSMDDAQGATIYRPEQTYGGDKYDALTGMKDAGGTMTAAGFVPNDAQVALGNPRSYINNPNITGKSVTSQDNVATKSGVTTAEGGTKVTPGTTNTNNPLKTLLDKVTGGANPAGDKKGMDPMTMMLLMYLMSQMGKSGGSSGTQASIPQLQANQRMLPYTAPSRPGAGGQTYFSPQTYTPKASGGMIGYAGGGGISTLGGYSDGGRLLRGPGDGVSDNIPATIAGKQPARLADGEFVVPARIVSELGNGSTDAGAKRLYEMMDRVQKARRKTKNVAADTKAAKYLPA